MWKWTFLSRDERAHSSKSAKRFGLFPGREPRWDGEGWVKEDQRDSLSVSMPSPPRNDHHKYVFNGHALPKQAAHHAVSYTGVCLSRGGIAWLMTLASLCVHSMSTVQTARGDAVDSPTDCLIRKKHIHNRSYYLSLPIMVSILLLDIIGWTTVSVKYLPELWVNKGHRDLCKSFLALNASCRRLFNYYCRSYSFVLVVINKTAAWS